ncbi:MAG: hypothetical protein RI935_212 [Candidatus Parcubacteria bacterium]|jgi:hypothetical protein
MKQSSHFVTSSLIVLACLSFTHAQTPSQVPTTEIASSSKVETKSATSTASKARHFTECSQDAIELRDTSLSQMRAEYNKAMNEALLQRKEMEKKSFTIVDEKDRRDFTKTSVEAYKTKIKELQSTLTEERKKAWSEFESNTKECRELLEAGDNNDKKDDKKDVSKKEMRQETKESQKEQEQPKTSLLQSIRSLFSKE